MEEKTLFDINKFVSEFNRYDYDAKIRKNLEESTEEEAASIASKMYRNKEIQRILSGMCL